MRTWLAICLVAVALLIANRAHAQYCPSYTASSPNNTYRCATNAVRGTNPTVAEWQNIFALVSKGPSTWGSQGPSVGNINQGCGKPEATKSVAPRFPCELLKAIAMQESLWQQFCVPTSPSDQAGKPSQTIIAIDCGYGVGQVTSGMRTYDPAPSFDRARVAGDATYNLATGTRILAEKWRATQCVGDRQPDIIENWYSATWAYNGLAYINNPSNPTYSSNRGVWNPPNNAKAPYQEKVFGRIQYPNTANHWTSVALAYPNPGSVGSSGSPPALAEPSCASPTNCVSKRDTHRSSCLPPPGPPPPPPCVPTEEICDGKDNNCDGKIDEGEVCERDFLLRSPGVYTPSRASDMDGDGRSDACGRGMSGFFCMLAREGGSFEKSGFAGLTNAAGWSQAKHYSTIRMGDIDGDGRADVCARGPERVHCWKSTGSGFSAALDGPAWADSVGWGNPQYYTTIRLLDIDGDGRDDICARAAAGIRCFLSNGNGFGTSITGPEWSNAKGFDLPRYYGTLRTGDINGDGKDDLCIRTPDGIECFLSNGSAFPTRVQGPAWADSVGWGSIRYWSTLRMADINGDGKADICARGVAGYFCALSQGTSFAGSTLLIPELSDANGWNDEVRYETIRTGDIDGDGAEEICARAEDRVYCFRFTASGMEKISGPAWADTSGWRAHHHNSTLSLADVNGDGKADICARAAAGWLCSLSTGSGFSGPVSVAEFTSSGGWTDSQYYTTLRSGGLCRDGVSCAPLPGDSDAGTDPGADPDADAGGEWEPDSGFADNDGGPGASPWPEAGSPIGNGDGLGDPAADDVMVDADSGCQCTMAGRKSSSLPFVLGIGLLALYRLRSRRN